MCMGKIDSSRSAGSRQITSFSTSNVMTPDAERLFIRTWQGKGPQQRELLVVHGMGEHSGRYGHLIEHLSDVFGAIHAFDLRGHGCSTGLRGDAPQFDTFCEDALLIAQSIVGHDTNKELTLLGHSMGGLISLRLLQLNRSVPFQKAIISAPFLGLSFQVPSWKKALGHVLARTLPRLQLASDVNPSYLSHDPEVVAAYVKDRLVHNKCTPRLYFEMMGVLEKVRSHTDALPCPSLFLVPGVDRVVDSEVTLKFVELLKDRNKVLKTYPDFYHEPLNELEKERVFHDIRVWLGV